MKGDVISDHVLVQWLQKDSLDTVGFRTFRGGVLNFTIFLVLPFVIFTPDPCTVDKKGETEDQSRCSHGKLRSPTPKMRRVFIRGAVSTQYLDRKWPRQTWS